MHRALNIKCIRALCMTNALTLFTSKGHMTGQELKVLNSQNRRSYTSGCYYISHTMHITATNFMEQGPSWDINSSSDRKEMICILLRAKAYYPHTPTHTHARARTHMHACTHTHPHTHTSSSSSSSSSILIQTVAYPGIMFGRGGSTNSVEDRTERTGIWGRKPRSQGLWRQM